jgi:5-methylthioribose kinase
MLADMGLKKPREPFSATMLGGGISCDVYHVRFARSEIVLKRALPKLRVAEDWLAPVERAASEAAWLRLVAGIHPQWVPRILGEAPARNAFAMEYLPPEEYPVWKSELAQGRIDLAFTRKVGAALARIHSATAGRPEAVLQFQNAEQFFALRTEPYLLHAASKNAAVAGIVREIAEGLTMARVALMHGDASPKNILCGPHGPVFLDPEPTSYGDPAFDLAFCLNHLLLKSVWHRQWLWAYTDAFTALKESYLAGVTWEQPAATEARAAQILPALLLARIDGKSPVEYLTGARDCTFVRNAAKVLLLERLTTLDSIAARWKEFRC